jgi:hypothetical protein
MMCFQKIEQGYGFLLLLFGGQSWFARPVDIGYRGHPGGTEFFSGIRSR